MDQVRSLLTVGMLSMKEALASLPESTGLSLSITGVFFHKRPIVYNERGLVLKALDRPAEAVADFRKAQTIDSADPASKRQLNELGF